MTSPVFTRRGEFQPWHDHPGPWQNEPDEWFEVDEATGLTMLALRAKVGGFWCGYVRLPDGHPWIQTVDRDGEPDAAYPFEVGAGLDVEVIIQLRDRDGWWAGFDMHHLGQKSPAEIADPTQWWVEGWYVGLVRVKTKCRDLAADVAGAA